MILTLTSGLGDLEAKHGDENQMKQIRLYIPIEPEAQQRHRYTTIYPKGKPPFVQTYDPSAEYKKQIQRRAFSLLKDAPQKLILPIEGKPLSVSVTFFLTRPKTGTREYPSTRPDLDNMIKAALDALNGILWHDDALIVRIHDSEKLYAGPGRVPGFELIVTPHNEADHFPAPQVAMELSGSPQKKEKA